MKDDGFIEMNNKSTNNKNTNKTSMSKLNNNNNNSNNQSSELNGVISSSLVSSIVNSFNNAAASSSRSSSPSFCSSSFTTNSSFTNKKCNHSRNSSMSGGLMNDDSGVVPSEDIRIVKTANHKRTSSNSNVDNSTIITNNSVRAMANLLNRTSSTRSSVTAIKHLPPPIMPSQHSQHLLNFIDNDTSSVFDDNITTSSSVSSNSNQNDQMTQSSTNSHINNNNQLNKSNRSSISNATTNNLDDYLDGNNGDDLCNLSKLKIQQEEIKFNNLLNECQLWIEVNINIIHLF